MSDSAVVCIYNEQGYTVVLAGTAAASQAVICELPPGWRPPGSSYRKIAEEYDRLGRRLTQLEMMEIAQPYEFAEALRGF